ncbi:MAG: hypothetical protein L0H29_09885 [Sinobacteraceae bacterium]|nr:hypothetical protein [Nevskiaceae bacterium]
MATVAVAATVPTSATTARQGVSNAKIHASVAARIDTLSGVHLHLHHVLNCLVGPHGKLYSAKAEALSAYHCDQIPDGAADDPHASAKVRKLANAAVHEALAGIHAENVQAGHRDATHVIQTLDAIERAWPAKS